MFAARWALAPIYLGLLVGVVLMMVQFVSKLISVVPRAFTVQPGEVILAVLQMVDLALAANLVMLVFFAGWENLMGPFTADERHGYGELGFSAVKLRLLGAVAVIAAVDMLETFFHIDEISKADVMWQIAILLAIGVTGVLLALVDRLSGH